MRRPRTQGARQQPAPRRRSDQVSRRMVGRWTVEPVGRRVVENRMRRPDRMAHRLGGGQGWPRLNRLQDAYRGQRTVLTVLVLLLVRTAGHVCGHRHVGHAARMRLRRNSWRSQRGHRQADGHEDRESQMKESPKIHGLTSHGTGSFGRSLASHVRQSQAKPHGSLGERPSARTITMKSADWLRPTVRTVFLPPLQIPPCAVGQITFRTSSRFTPEQEGRFATVTKRWVGMRWTSRHSRTSHAWADGEVVWA